MKRWAACLLLVLTLSTLGYGQDAAYLKEIEAYRAKENAKFRDPDKSPLSVAERLQFKGHDFFPIDPDYRVVADFVATPDAKPFPIPTNTGRSQLYKKLGDLNFELKGEQLSLEVYKQVSRFGPPLGDLLFLPILDETSGESTYGGGRYLHYEGTPEGTKWIIDFNKLYNPSCAYSERYECPLVPEPNHLPVKVEAGIKGY